MVKGILTDGKVIHRIRLFKSMAALLKEGVAAKESGSGLYWILMDRNSLDYPAAQDRPGATITPKGDPMLALIPSTP